MNNAKAAKKKNVVQTLLDAGIRTVGFAFDGAGDSGSVDGLMLWPDPGASLETIRDCKDPDRFMGTGAIKWYTSSTPSFVSDSTVALAQTLHSKAELLTESHIDAELIDLAYAALEYFGGDWVNNDGGFGTVAIDLVTGDFEIWGHQRYTETTPVNSHGTLKFWKDADLPANSHGTLKFRKDADLPAKESTVASEISAVLGVPTT